MDKLSDDLEVDLWFDPLDSNPDGDSFYDYDEWLNNTSPFVYNLTLDESKEAFLKGAALGDWATADNIEILLGQITFSFVPFVADVRDYFANVFVNLDTWAAIFNVGGFVLDFIPAAGVAGDATKALPKLGRFVAKYADDAPKVVEAIIRSSKLFPNADEVLPGLVKIIPAGALDDIAGSIKNGDNITKADYTELQKVFETAGKNADETVEGMGSTVDPNKLNRIFGKTEHNLDTLLSKFGEDKVKAYNALEKATQQYVNSNKITGTFKDVVVNVNGVDVTVRGAVINGQVKIGTAFIP